MGKLWSKPPRRRFLLALAFGSISVGCGSDDEGTEKKSDPRFEELVVSMQERHAEQGVPGGAVAVIVDGKLAHSAGIGVKALGGTDPVTPDTRFHIASVTKLHVALAALSLADDGMLALDAPVTDYVPELKFADGFDAKTITLHHLLSHTSGIPDRNPITVPNEWLTCPVGPTVLGEYFTTHVDQPLWSKPGELYNYSNQGFSLAGLVVERAAGKPFVEVLEERVFDRGGLDAHTFDIGVTMAGDHALGHREENGQTGAGFEPDKYQCDVDAPAAGLMTSAKGLARLAELMLTQGAGVISPDSYAKMSADHTPMRAGGNGRYGYGWIHFDYKGLDIWGHDGDYYGYRTDVVIVPEKNFGVVVVENRSPSSMRSTTLRALDLFLDLTDIPLATETKTTSELEAYVGPYFEPYRFGNIETKLAGDGLEISILGGALKFPAAYVGGDTFSFVFQGTPGTVTFWPGPSGSFDTLASRAGVGRRVTP